MKRKDMIKKKLSKEKPHPWADEFLRMLEGCDAEAAARLIALKRYCDQANDDMQARLLAGRKPSPLLSSYIASKSAAVVYVPPDVEEAKEVAKLVANRAAISKDAQVKIADVYGSLNGEEFNEEFMTAVNKLSPADQ